MREHRGVTVNFPQDGRRVGDVSDGVGKTNCTGGVAAIPTSYIHDSVSLDRSWDGVDCQTCTLPDDVSEPDLFLV